MLEEVSRGWRACPMMPSDRGFSGCSASGKSESGISTSTHLTNYFQQFPGCLNLTKGDITRAGVVGNCAHVTGCRLQVMQSPFAGCLCILPNMNKAGRRVGQQRDLELIQRKIQASANRFYVRLFPCPAAIEGISCCFSPALRFDFSDHLHLRSQERVILAVF